MRSQALTKLFLRGLGVVLPLALTLYAVWWLVAGLERMLHWLWLRLLPAEWYFTGLGILIGVLVIALVGVAASAWVGRLLLEALEGLLLRIPLVKTVYASVRDLVSFAGGKKPGLGRVVVAEIAPGVRMIGLVTKEEAERLTALPGDAGNAAVYLPMAYNLGGYMVLLPRERLERLDMKVEDALRLAMTAGIVEERGIA